MNSFSCQNNNKSLQPCQAFHFDDTDASIIGFYTTEAGAYENATIIEHYHGKTSQALPSKEFPMRWTWWPSSNHSLPDWLRVGYHLPFYRSAWSETGPTPLPTPPTPPPTLALPTPRPKPPHPAPTPVPISPQCIATLERVCPGEKGKGRECETCLHNHTKDMLAGGCTPAPDGSLYNVIKPYCNLAI